MPTLRVLLAVSLALLVPRPSLATGEWDRNGFDVDDLATLNQRDPKLGAALLHGEAELHAGNYAAAARTFEQLTQTAPESALAKRRYCQALTEKGDRAAALLACQATLAQKRSYVGFRAFVGALVSAPPTPEELDLAAQLANAARQHVADQPWGLAAQGEIAERTGDERMLEKIVAELERIAPGHYETVRARAALDRNRLSGWAWGAWFAIALAGLATAVHAAIVAFGTSRKRRRGPLLAAALLLVGGALLCARPSLAAPESADETPPPGGLSKWPVNESDPKKSLPTPEQRDQNPMEFGYHMMDLADKADIAKRKGDFAAVARYYEAMSVAVPDRAIGYRRSCEAYEQIGNTEKALQLCRGALGADGLEVQDYLHFVKLVLAKPGPLTPADVDDVAQIATHLKAEPGAMTAGLKLQCDLAQRLDDLPRMQECVSAVTKRAPNDPMLVIYRWGVAMKQEDYDQARALITSARNSRIRPAGIEVMERMTAEQSALGRRILRTLARHAVPFAAGLASLLAAGFWLWLRKRLVVRPAGLDAQRGDLSNVQRGFVRQRYSLGS